MPAGGYKFYLCLQCSTQYQLTICCILVINTSLMSDEMSVIHSLAEIMAFSLFYRINTELGNIFTTDNITSISKHKCT